MRISDWSSDVCSSDLSLARGVIDGAALPYEVALPLKIHELTTSHTEIGGQHGLYTAVFLFTMNKARYEALPADLRAVIDANSGIALAKQIGRVWDEAEQPGRAAAKASGASFHSIAGEELARWQAATAGVNEAWTAAKIGRESCREQGCQNEENKV